MNPTQAAGLLIFAIAVIACVRTARLRFEPVWRWLALLSLYCLLDVAFDIRHLLHGWVNGWLVQLGWYAKRRPYQILLLVAVALLVLVPLALRTRKIWQMDRTAGVAVLACVAGVGVLLVEAVSLHAVDAIMYRQAGPVPVVGWLWVIAGGTTAGMAVRAGRAAPVGTRRVRRAPGPGRAHEAPSD